MSVVVPCYNYGAYLPACVESVLRQPRVDVEVVVVDDASTDGSGELAEALAHADDRVRVIRHRTNQGHIRTYNEGLALVQGDYVVLLSADDLLTEGSLARATDLMESEPSVGMVYGSAVRFSGQLPPRPRLHVRSWTIWQGWSWVAEQCRTGLNRIASPEVVLRTAVLRELGGYASELPHSGDFDMWLRAAAVSDVGLLGGVDQAFYRVHPESMSQTTHASLLVQLASRAEAFDHALAAQGHLHPDAEVLRRAAHRAIALDVLRYAAQDGPAAPVLGSADRVELRELARSLSPDVLRIPRATPRGVTLAWDTFCSRIAWHRWRWSGV
ncbi:MAG: glycosyltransferase family 2 protein [Motilibacteraceae bacterium]